MKGLPTRSRLPSRVRKLSGYKFTSGNIGRAGVSCPPWEFAAACLFFPLFRVCGTASTNRIAAALATAIRLPTSTRVAILLLVELLRIERACWSRDSGENRKSNQGGYDGLHGYSSKLRATPLLPVIDEGMIARSQEHRCRVRDSLRIFLR